MVDKDKFKKHADLGKDLLPVIIKDIERNKDRLFSGIKMTHDYGHVPEYSFANTLTGGKKEERSVVSYRIGIIIDMEER